MGEISNIGSVKTLVRVAALKGVNDVVLSPGSRNAPFIISFNGFGGFNCQSVLDERSAGFIALGLAQQKKKPVILSCTSGSAVLNYSPALVEAYYQNIPLIAVTSDRPTEWIDQGEGQSIRQMRLMDNILVKSFNLVDERNTDDHWFNNRMINEAFELAISTSKPVQINVPLKEPLYGTEESEQVAEREFKLLNSETSLSISNLHALEGVFSKAERILILVAQGSDSAKCIDALRQLNGHSRIAILTETHANLYHLGFVSCIDRTFGAFLDSEKEVEFVPDLLITVGGNVISKKIKSFFRKYNHVIKDHWHFGDDVVDTYQSLTALIDAEASSVLQHMASLSSASTSQFGNQWRAQFFKMEQKHNAYVSSVAYSDLKAFQLILDFIPDGTNLQMGNSSVVRYIQLFNHIQTISYFGNRGVSGIEGCTSTAVGASQAYEGLTLLISGDQAFRYDSNAFATKKDSDRLRVIVINNGGGSIFRIIDGPKNHQVNEEFIEKVDEQSIRKLVEYHNLEYLEATDEASLENGLIELFSPERNTACVLEIFTPRLESPQILKEYFKYLREGD